MNIKKVVRTRYISDEGFEFRFAPIEDTLTIKELPGNLEERYEVRYLVQDEHYEFPDKADYEVLFHVNYHRDYWVTNDEVITEGDLKAWYKGEKIPQEDKYYIFPLKSLIHSGVWLQLGSGGFEADPGGWDTSRVGAVLVAKGVWETEEKAIKAAESLVKDINDINTGAVFGCVKEIYRRDKGASISHDDCWGFVGYEHALRCLEDFA